MTMLRSAGLGVALAHADMRGPDFAKAVAVQIRDDRRSGAERGERIHRTVCNAVVHLPHLDGAVRTLVEPIGPDDLGLQEDGARGPLGEDDMASPQRIFDRMRGEHLAFDWPGSRLRRCAGKGKGQGQERKGKARQRLAVRHRSIPPATVVAGCCSCGEHVSCFSNTGTAGLRLRLGAHELGTNSSLRHQSSRATSGFLREGSPFAAVLTTAGAMGKAAVRRMAPPWLATLDRRESPA